MPFLSPATGSCLWEQCQAVGDSKLSLVFWKPLKGSWARTQEKTTDSCNRKTYFVTKSDACVLRSLPKDQKCGKGHREMHRYVSQSPTAAAETPQGLSAHPPGSISSKLVLASGCRSRDLGVKMIN